MEHWLVDETRECSLFQLFKKNAFHWLFMRVHKFDNTEDVEKTESIVLVVVPPKTNLPKPH